MSNFHPPEAVASILSNRYFQKNEDWNALCRRVAAGAASTEPEELREEWEQKFYTLINQGLGLPNTPALVNLGANHTGSVAACFSFRPDDHMDSIMEVSRLAAMTLKFGGGAGFELSKLRPAGSLIQSTHKHAMGPIGVMKFYNAVGDMITQAGIRKAALIAILRIDHPDVVKFCRAKLEDKALANFNISVSIPDGFMKKLTKEPDKPHVCRFNNKQYHILSNGEPILRAERGSKKVLSVREIYDLLCEGGAANGDPGVFFVDHVNRDNPLIDGINDIDNPFYMAGSNPCLPADQKVYVADGRGFVSIKQLAEELKDIPVFCLDNNKKLVTRIMRHPRLTGKNRKILKIRLSDNGEIRCTENHKIMLLDGSYKEAKDLRSGDRLKHGKTFEAPIEEIINGSNSRSQLYIWDKVGDRNPIANHRLIAQTVINRSVKTGEIVHHKDRNGRNNKPDNLQVMTKQEHDNLHRADMLGDKNPMRRFPEKNWLIKQDWSGSKNGRYIEISNEDYFNKAVEACSNIGRLLSKREWQAVCKQQELPFGSKYRLESLGFSSTSDLLMAAAEKAVVFRDPKKIKSYRRYQELKKSYDLPVEFDPTKGILVVKQCEYCEVQFRTHWTTREIGYCSILCANKAKGPILSEAQQLKVESRQKDIRQKQIDVYLNLQNSLKRDPLQKEWKAQCKAKQVPYRIRSTSGGNRYCFKTFTEVKQAASEHLNFKVLSIEEDGFEDVYNGTIDDFHNLITVASINKTKSGNTQNHWVISRQCGELPLSHAEACILGSIDLAKFVIDGDLDTIGLTQSFRTMTRFLDDMIDVSAWPDSQIEEKVHQTRRLGVGVMGFTSMLDKMTIKYGSEECIKMIDIIGTIRETSCLEESKQLAKERGVYPAAPEGENRRNVALTTGPPTGTLAMIANTSWSIEPHLYWAFEERRNDEVRIRYLPAVEDYIPAEELEELVDTANGDLAHLNDLIQAKLPGHMILAKEVTPEQHLKILATWQKYTESAISKTICAPADILTPSVVADIYQTAWENKIKGITVYPEGSREGEPMSVGKKKKKIEKSLPQSLKSDRHEFQVQLGNKMRKVFAFVGLDPKEERHPVEVFLKHPYVQDPMAIQFIDLTTRLLSLALRYRTCPECGEEVIPLGKIIKQLRETDGQSMFSVPSIFVKALGKYLSQGESVGTCPSPGCNGNLTLIEGCESCVSCGFRSCG